MFSGESKTRRVAIKSKTTTVARDAVLSSAKSEREQRALEKARTIAATKLQSAYRSSRSRHQWRSGEFALLQKRVGDLKKVNHILAAAGKKSAPIPVAAQLQLVRSCIFVVNAHSREGIHVVADLLAVLAAGLHLGDLASWSRLAETDSSKYIFMSSKLIALALRLYKYVSSGNPCWHERKEGVAMVSTLIAQVEDFSRTLLSPKSDNALTLEIIARIFTSDIAKDILQDTALRIMDTQLLAPHSSARHGEFCARLGSLDAPSGPKSHAPAPSDKLIFAPADRAGEAHTPSDPLDCPLVAFLLELAGAAVKAGVEEGTGSLLFDRVVVPSGVLAIPFLFRHPAATSFLDALLAHNKLDQFWSSVHHYHSTTLMPDVLRAFTLGNLCDLHVRIISKTTQPRAYQANYIAAVSLLLARLPRGLLSLPALPSGALTRRKRLGSESLRTPGDHDSPFRGADSDVDIEEEEDEDISERAERNPSLALGVAYRRVARLLAESKIEHSDSGISAAGAGMSGSKRARSQAGSHAQAHQKAAFMAKHKQPLLSHFLLHEQIELLQAPANLKLLSLTAMHDFADSSANLISVFSLLYQIYDAAQLKLTLHSLTSEGIHSSLGKIPKGATLQYLQSLASARAPLPFSLFLWRSLNNLPQLTAFLTDAHQACADFPEVAHSLILFLVVFGYDQMTTDDLSFFEAADFPLEDVKCVLTFLRKLLYRLCWADKSASDLPLSRREVASIALLDAGISAFNTLFDRQSRRAFVPSDAWLWPTLPRTEISAEVLAGLAEELEPESSALSPTGGVADGSRASIRRWRAQMVLTMIPHVVPFDTRVELFSELRSSSQEGMRFRSRSAPITIRRAHLVEDSFEAFKSIRRAGGSIKDDLRISFINLEGLPEAGIDGGGLLKEFVDSVVKAAFSPSFFLFCETAEHTVYPNPHSGMSSSGHLSYFEFLGQLLGKALLEGILVEPRFAIFFLRKLIGKANLVDDLASLDPVMHKSLMSLKKYDGDFADLGLTFEVSEEVLGEKRLVPLCVNGADVPVTRDNLAQYMMHLANYKLNRQIAEQCRAFLQGFRELVPLTWIRMFGAHELQTLIGGSEAPIDVDDLRRNTVYGTGYYDSHPVVQMFWSVLKSLDEVDKRAFLMFVTSCSRPPLLGFSSLHPKFGISRVAITDDNERLPSAATCMALFKLPEYSSAEVMKQKLLLSIHSGAGFELS